MAAICFTGRGNLNGVFMDRVTWSTMARNEGHYIVDSAYGASTILVASRTDTRKATEARHSGVTVIDYDTFYSRLLSGDLRRISTSLSMDEAMRAGVDLAEQRALEKVQMQEQANNMNRDRKAAVLEEERLRRAIHL